MGDRDDICFCCYGLRKETDEEYSERLNKDKENKEKQKEKIAIEKQKEYQTYLLLKKRFEGDK